MTRPLDRLAPWLGTFAGTEGSGRCPTGREVLFSETLTLARRPDEPWVRWIQHEVGPTGTTLHEEAGFVRWAGDAYEVAFAMNSGRMALARGQIEDRAGGPALVLASREFHNDRLGVVATERVLALRSDGSCHKTLALATDRGWPQLTPHMAAVLWPVPVGGSLPG